MTWKTSQEKDQEVCHYFCYIVLIGMNIGKLIFYQEMN